MQNIHRQSNVVKDVRVEVNATLVHKIDSHNLTQYYMVFANDPPKTIGAELC